METEQANQPTSKWEAVVVSTDFDNFKFLLIEQLKMGKIHTWLTIICIISLLIATCVCVCVYSVDSDIFPFNCATINADLHNISEIVIGLIRIHHTQTNYTLKHLKNSFDFYILPYKIRHLDRMTGWNGAHSVYKYYISSFDCVVV